MDNSESQNDEDSTSIDDYDFGNSNLTKVPHYFTNTQKPITLTLPYEKKNQVLFSLYIQRSFRNNNDSNKFQNNVNLVDNPETIQKNYQNENQRLQSLHVNRISRQFNEF